MKKTLNYDFNEVQNVLAGKIATLELQLANEIAAKNAVVKYAEELEKKIEKLEGKKNAE